MWKRNRVLFGAIAISFLLFNFKHSQADNAAGRYTQANVADSAARVYAGFNFDKGAKLAASVFEFAYNGYLRMLDAGKVLRPGIITVIDYSLSSNVPRLWVLDLASRRIIVNALVAHGQGTGAEFAEKFSNRENSHQTSLGFYTTGGTYQGEHGLSLYLHGMDPGFNDAAFSRSVVLHGAAYVSESFIQANKRLGRSWGCPAVSEALAPELIRLLQGGTCMFLYFPDRTYLSASRWLRGEDGFSDAFSHLRLPEATGLEQETKL